MNRRIYQTLICLHPATFREQHRDEMLCIFDESAPCESRPLIADAIRSIVRQWVFHSAWWRLLAGAGVSVALLLGLPYSMNRDFDWSMRWGAHHWSTAVAPEKPLSTLSQPEFAREAQEAVKILARDRRSSEHRRPGFMPAVVPLQDAPPVPHVSHRE